MKLHNADIPNANIPPPIETTCTESYYTRTVWHCIMQMYPVLIDPPTPPWIEPKCRDLYYTSTVWHCRMQRYQVLLYPQPTKCTEAYYTRTVWHCRMQMYSMPIYCPTVPLSNEMLQRCMTVGQYDIAKCRYTQCWSNHPH